ncbi:hypothetical protein SARC_00859 [Sphaeroforma arctica JP610]|uniref:Uncharacterized protein n=1 Tax=Sphaeroforma arctica JP610 TaxID=667725 RepID=A0A0L0GDP2_9EUKA|nr:hypothetical protein SARC_00859 [Sphaeroforma arctica JP610]KNC87006.1 hypothetical protein SARC_00859 [Sphaeroforma arctica JP610]|eukprot:XP_014160908.1 hypothetical protein SARC_00859 [Sphaeroforma arctica JP610]
MTANLVLLGISYSALTHSTALHGADPIRTTEVGTLLGHNEQQIRGESWQLHYPIVNTSTKYRRRKVAALPNRIGESSDDEENGSSDSGTDRQSENEEEGSQAEEEVLDGESACSEEDEMARNVVRIQDLGFSCLF